MRAEFTPRARARIATVRGWWRRHRPDAPRLFLDELRAAVATIRERPEAVPVHRTVRALTMRRVLLPKTRQFLYYSVDSDAGVVTIHSVWGAQRGSEPKL